MLTPEREKQIRDQNTAWLTYLEARPNEFNRAVFEYPGKIADLLGEIDRLREALGEIASEADDYRDWEPMQRIRDRAIEATS